MIAGKYLSSIKEAKKFLKEIGLLEDCNPSPSVPAGFAAICRSKNCVDQWSYLFKNRIYTFLLKDQSIILCRNQSDYSISYVDCPFVVPDFEDYWNEVLGDEWVDYDREILRDDFDQYLETIVEEREITPIRFDYAPECYRAGAHPCAHFHIGSNDHLRIGSKTILSPFAFSLFIARQMHPKTWEKYLESLDEGRLRFLESRVRTNLEIVPKFNSDIRDRCEMYLY